MRKNLKLSFMALSLVLAVLLTACGNSENGLNGKITASESVSESISDSSAETKSETTTATAETRFETTTTETETSTEAATSKSVSESDTETEEEEKDTSVNTPAETVEVTVGAITEATVAITATSTEAAVSESEQTNVSEIEAVTEEETSVSEGSVSKEMAALKTAVSLHEIHKEEDVTIDLEISEPKSSSGIVFDVGMYVPFDYEDECYVCHGECVFVSDAERNITVLTSGTNEADDVMMNFDKSEYMGMIGENSYADEADVYRYEDKLIVIYNAESYPLYALAFREQFYGFSHNENYDIGYDLEKLKKALLERSIEYDPSVYLCALIYVKWR